MSVGTYLSNLSSALVLSSSENDSIRTSVSTLEARLAQHFNSSEVTAKFQFGSNTRGTILPRKADSQSDVDYMIVFSTADGKKKPQTYLDRLKKFAEERYSQSEIYQSHPTLVLSLNHINFELVPAIYESGFMIPSPSTSYAEWIYTNPQKANDDLATKNKDNGFHIKPLVRLIKYWNAKNGFPFYSYSIEQGIVSQYYFSCAALKDYFYSYWSFFNCPPDASQATKEKVELARSRSRTAKSLEEKGDEASAEMEIKRMLPPL